jgi:pyruvate dehydrogenase E1 component beta subunit
MGKTLRETIKGITRKHLTENNGIILGECLSAVGWVNNTVPDCKNLVELPMIDVAGAGIAVGAALVGRRPIFVIRFQDFLFLNSSLLINYAGKTKDIFGKGTPIFIRALSTEGGDAGPVHSGVFHSIFMHVPGFRVCAPMTSGEYKKIWKVFMKNDDPMLISEHRRSFDQKEEMKNKISSDADITIYGISAARYNIIEAAKLVEQEGIKCNIVHILWLKPLDLLESIISPLKQSKLGLVVDSGFEIAGASQSIAYELMAKTGFLVKALGAEDRSVGAAKRYENTTPKPQKIAKIVRELVNRKIFKK